MVSVSGSGTSDGVEVGEGERGSEGSGMVAGAVG